MSDQKKVSRKKTWCIVITMDHLLLVWMNVTFNPHDRKASNISTSNIVDVATVLVELLRFSLDLLKPNRLVYIGAAAFGRLRNSLQL